MMHISNDILDVLIAHFDKRGWPEHVNREKLRERISFEQTEDGQNYVAKIERHRSCLGATYFRGLGMSAFQTYLMQYEVNLATEEVTELPNKFLPVDSLNIDLYALVNQALDRETFSLEISSLDNGKYLIQETVSKDKAVVERLDEAISFARTLSDGIADYFDIKLDMDLSDSHSDEQIREIKTEYARLLDEALIERTRAVWKQDVDDEF